MSATSFSLFLISLMIQWEGKILNKFPHHYSKSQEREDNNINQMLQINLKTLESTEKMDLIKCLRGGGVCNGVVGENALYSKESIKRV